MQWKKFQEYLGKRCFEREVGSSGMRESLWMFVCMSLTAVDTLLNLCSFVRKLDLHTAKLQLLWQPLSHLAATSPELPCKATP